jgi:2-dehydropantoate 2-reductase
MKIAIVGAGAIGGLLGTRLALSGQEVTFIARNRNLVAINAGGFRLRWPDGREEQAASVKAVERGDQAGVQDAVLITVKAHQVHELVEPIAAMTGPETLLVTMINGVPWWYFHRHGGPHEGRQLDSVDPGGKLWNALPREALIGSVVYPAAELVEPGLVRWIDGNRFTLGELDGSRSDRLAALSEVMMAAGFKAPVARDIRAELWVKLWGNCSFNPISALTGQTLEALCRCAPTRDLAARIMREAQAVGEALGVQFKIGIEQRIAGAEAVGAHKTSMLQDIEAGRAPELDALVSAVIELGRIAGVATPTMAVVEALVRGKVAVGRA